MYGTLVHVCYDWTHSNNLVDSIIFQVYITHCLQICKFLSCVHHNFHGFIHHSFTQGEMKSFESLGRAWLGTQHLSMHFSGVWQRSWKMQAVLSNMRGYTYFVHMKSLSILQLVVWNCSYIPNYKGHTSFGMNGNLGIKNMKLFHLKLWQNRYTLERTCKDIERYCEGHVKEPIMFWNVKCIKIILG